MRHLVLLAIVAWCDCAPPLIEPVAPGRYKINDPSKVDIHAEAAKLCGPGVRYSYDAVRKNDYVRTSAYSTTTYWSEGLLVCDPEAAATPRTP